MKFNKRAPAPNPVYEDVCALARTLAREDGLRCKDLLNLIIWPKWASPPLADIVLFYGKLADEYREKARAILIEQMAARPRPRIKKRIKRPNLKRYWTFRSSLVCGHNPPPRRRGWLPPIPVRSANRAAPDNRCRRGGASSIPPVPAASQPGAPPGYRLAEEGSERRPRRRDRMTLLFPVTGISGAPVVRDSQTLLGIRIAA